MRVICRIRKEPYYRRDAFERGLKTVGFVMHEKMKPEGPTDWLVLWNRKRGQDEMDAQQWEARGGTVVVAENGYLQRQDKTTYAISVGQHNGAGWFPVGDEDRFTKLGYPLMRWREECNLFPETVIRLQRGIGSISMASPASWPKMAAQIVAERYKGSCRVIQHPGNFAPRVPPEKDLQYAGLFCTWSSSMGVLALTLGIPVFYGAPRWICEQGAAPFGEFPVPRFDYKGRDEAMHRMSHGQWHYEEIAAGEPFARILQSERMVTC